MYMAKKTQYCEDVSSSQFEPQIQHNRNQNPSQLFLWTLTNWLSYLYEKAKDPEEST